MESMECGTCGKDDCSAKAQKANEDTKDFLERQALHRRMCKIKHKVIVLSGKGGVGKSTIAVNLAMSLALARKKVGLLDVDVHGPSIPTLLGLEGRQPTTVDGAIYPMLFEDKLRVMSLGFFLPRSDEAVIWRGPVKMGLIKQFLRDVEWGTLDYLVIDCPPGTGDEPLSVVQLIEDATGAIIVTTPQEVALADVRKSITFCRTVNLPVLGVIENMSGFICPTCGSRHDIFKSGGGRRMADQMGVPFLGQVPIDPRVVTASDEGQPFCRKFAGTETAKVFEEVIRPILAITHKEAGSALER